MLSYTFSCLHLLLPVSLFFFFNDTATTEIYTLSLHDALPISLLRLERRDVRSTHHDVPAIAECPLRLCHIMVDRKSTRLNSSHGYISYAVFCLKKKKTKTHGENSSGEGTHTRDVMGLSLCVRA